MHGWIGVMFSAEHACMPPQGAASVQPQPLLGQLQRPVTLVARAPQQRRALLDAQDLLAAPIALHPDVR
jgi:hypothetical protein